jgi:hypothetical protein
MIIRLFIYAVLWTYVRIMWNLIGKQNLENIGSSACLCNLLEIIYGEMKIKILEYKSETLQIY